MDKITEGLLNDFIKSNGLTNSKEAISDNFEHFINYSIVSSEYDQSFDFLEVSTGGGGDLAVDGIAIIVNNVIVEDEEQIEEILSLNKAFYQISFIFIQAKTSSSFEGNEMKYFGDGVCKIIENEYEKDINEDLQRKIDIIQKIYKYPAKFKQNPECKLYYATTGKWLNDKNLMSDISDIKNRLLDLDCLKTVEFHALGARDVRNFYKKAITSIDMEIEFEKKITLPKIDGIEQSYLGILPVKEYLKLIDKDGKINKNIFIDNIRDYQGENPVNIDIKKSIVKGKQDSFVLLNNGITIVCRKLKISSNIFIFYDYQIVNGCQTSHVIYDCKNEINDNMFVTVKVIESTNELAINSIIKATNRQTAVTDEQLNALLEFHKNMEDYFNSFEQDKRLYYERRSKQYEYRMDIDKKKVIAMPDLCKAIASMFFDKPHMASRAYGKLITQEGYDKFFNNTYATSMYYFSALSYYKLLLMFKSGQLKRIYKKFKFFFLAVLRYQILGKDMERFSSNKMIKACEQAIKEIENKIKFESMIFEIKKIIDENTDIYDREITKSQALLQKLLLKL